MSEEKSTTSVEELQTMSVTDYGGIESSGAPKPLGVPEDFVAELQHGPSDSTERFAQERIGGGPVGSESIPPRYFDGDHETVLSGLAPEAIWQVQQAMLAGGWSSGMRKGYYDDKTVTGIKKLMEAANRTGKTWHDLLRTSVAEGVGGGGGGGGGGALRPAYVAPDPATLAQTVKRSLRETLRRDPSTEELDVLARELSGFARQAYDAQMASAQGASTTDVDPGARFAELIETKYANELDLIETRDEGAVSQQQAQGQLSFVNRVMGGI